MNHLHQLRITIFYQYHPVRVLSLWWMVYMISTEIRHISGPVLFNFPCLFAFCRTHNVRILLFFKCIMKNFDWTPLSCPNMVFVLWNQSFGKSHCLHRSEASMRQFLNLRHIPNGSNGLWNGQSVHSELTTFSTSKLAYRWIIEHIKHIGCNPPDSPSIMHNGFNYIHHLIVSSPKHNS